MKFIELIKSEFANFGKYERIVFPLVIAAIIVISIITGDNKIALVSAVCGISYTILAGKGRISCYYIGIIGSGCYAYLSYVNGFYGNLLLYACYYIPMEIFGIFNWRKHLKKEVREIVKTNLTVKEKIIYFALSVILASILALILKQTGDTRPFIDSFTTIFSVLGLFLTVRRCIEQWYVWIFVNLFSFIMWIYAYIDGSNCLATVLMWFMYLILSVYFLFVWQKEIKTENNK